jgi:class 3 adenylate cyclase
MVKSPSSESSAPPPTPRAFASKEANTKPGRELALAILFCDLRNFTPLTERHLPYDVVHLLNRHFEAVGEPILTTTATSTCTLATRW